MEADCPDEQLSAFLAMSWPVPPELELPPPLSCLPEELVTTAAPAATAETVHMFPPLPPEELTHKHTQLYVAVIRWHTPPTHRVVCSGHPLAHTHTYTHNCM